MLFLASCKSKSDIITTKKPVSEINKSASVKKKKRKKIKASKINESIVFDDTKYILDEVLNIASLYEGVRYRYGGTTSRGMDCSGLIYTSFKNYDIILPRRSIDMSKLGKKISEKKAQKGDLIFFKTGRTNVINHVGIIHEVKNNEIIFIHASTSSGVMYSSLNESYFQRTFAQINRILE